MDVKMRRIQRVLTAKQQTNGQENEELETVHERLKQVTSSLLEERTERRLLEDKVDRLQHNFEQQQQRIDQLESILNHIVEMPNSPRKDESFTTENESTDPGKHIVKFVEVVKKQPTANGGGKSLGMLLGGGDNQNPVYVHKVIAGGAVQNQSQIAYGDLIDAVNGISVSGTAIKQVHTILKRSGDVVNLRMRRDPSFLARLRKNSKSPEANSSNCGSKETLDSTILKKSSSESVLPQPEFSSSSQSYTDTAQTESMLEIQQPVQFENKPSTQVDARSQDIVSEHLKKHKNDTCFMVSISKGNGSLGMAITGGTSTSDFPGIFVSDIMSTGAVAQTRKILTHDRILAVDGNDTRMATKNQAIGYLKSAKETVHLLIARSD
eukprot:m.77756 g.77756  ORF g.77756 m.77756 type:complete len:380 (+) comp25045_c0_seq1:132-1271(+)